MIYLLSAVASSALVSIVMRMGEGKIKNNMAMFVVNYMVSIGLARWYIGSINLLPKMEGIGIAVGLGTMAGILYLVNFALLQKNIGKNGVVLASTFMKLGVVIPTLMAILLFHEQPKAMQILGILLAIGAIIMIHFEKEEMGGAKSKGLLLVLLLCAGVTDSLANIYGQLGNPALGNQYLFFTFFAALLCAFLLCLKDRRKLSYWDVFFGILLGIPNYYSSRFLLLSLREVSAVIVYPVYSVATIVAVTLSGILFFREKMSKNKMFAMGMIFVALALLNL